MYFLPIYSKFFTVSFKNRQLWGAFCPKMHECLSFLFFLLSFRVLNHAAYWTWAYGLGDFAKKSLACKKVKRERNGWDKAFKINSRKIWKWTTDRRELKAQRNFLFAKLWESFLFFFFYEKLTCSLEQA